MFLSGQENKTGQHIRKHHTFSILNQIFFYLIICTSCGIKHYADTIKKHKPSKEEMTTHFKCFKTQILYDASQKDDPQTLHASPFRHTSTRGTEHQHSPLAPGCPDGFVEPAPLLNPRKHVGVWLECCYSPAVSIWHTSPGGPQPAGTAQKSLGAALDYTREEARGKPVP